jgi:hypothetical protein
MKTTAVTKNGDGEYEQQRIEVERRLERYRNYDY